MRSTPAYAVPAALHILNDDVPADLLLPLLPAREADSIGARAAAAARAIVRTAGGVR